MRITLSMILISFAMNWSVHLKAQDNIGDAIVSYAVSKEGKKVKRGECWDLVAESLDYAEADWQRPDGFGVMLDWEKETPRPGDIIEFRNVKIKSPDGYTLQMPKHFAIIQDILADKHFRILHQNYNGEKRVASFDLDLNYMVKGKVNVYRPSE